MFTPENKLARPDYDYVQSGEARKFLGETIRDTYGRFAGTLVGFCVDPSGEVRSVALDRGVDGFVEFPGERFSIEKEGMVVSPEWAAKGIDLGQNLTKVDQRLAALKELAKKMGIPEEKVDLMVGEGKNDGGQNLVEFYGKLAESMATRGTEIEKQTDALDEFVMNFTAQYKAGEIDEAIYEMTKDYCKHIRARNIREVEELSNVLKSMVEPVEPEAPQPPSEPVPQVRPVKAGRRKRTSGYTSTPRLTNIEAVKYEEYQPRRSSAQERLLAELS